VKESILVKDKAALKEQLPTNPFLSLLQPSTEKDIPCFGQKAFIESLLKIALSYLCFHGTPEQSQLPSGTKVLWLLAYLNFNVVGQGLHRQIGGQPVHTYQTSLSTTMYKQVHGSPLNKKLETALEQFENRLQKHLDVHLRNFMAKGYLPRELMPQDDRPESETDAFDSTDSDESDDDDRSKRAAAKKSFQQEQTKEQAKSEDKEAKSGMHPETHTLGSKLDRLKVERPALFREGPTHEPFLKGVDLSRDETCQECDFVPVKGWGNPFCSKCGQGDEVIKAVLSRAKDKNVAMLPALDKIIVLLGTTKMQKSPVSGVSQGHTLTMSPITSLPR